MRVNISDDCTSGLETLLFSTLDNQLFSEVEKTEKAEASSDSYHPESTDRQDTTHDPAMRNLVFGRAERPGNTIDAAEIPVGLVRDNDVAIVQRRPDEYSAQAASAARHSQ